MKNQIVYLLLIASLVFVASAAAKPPVKESPETKLACIEQARDDVARKLNAQVWESYFDWAKRTDNMADMSKFKGFRLRSLCDTVPALKTRWDADSAAYARWQEVLRTDPEYKSIHDEYIALRGTNNREKSNANLQRYNLLYERLRTGNPDYLPARDAKNASRRLRDEAIARYLLDYYRAQGRMLPTDEVIPYSQMQSLRTEYPVIVDLEQELALLKKLQKELREQRFRQQYDVGQQVKTEGNGCETGGAPLR